MLGFFALGSSELNGFRVSLIGWVASTGYGDLWVPVVKPDDGWTPQGEGTDG